MAGNGIFIGNALPKNCFADWGYLFAGESHRQSSWNPLREPNRKDWD